MRLALAEIRRAKLRFGLLTGAVGLLVFLILFQQALAGSLLTSFVGGIEHQSGEILVYGAESRRSVDGSRVTPEQVEAVAAVDGVEDSGPLGQGSFSTRLGGEDLVDTTIFGYEPGAPGGPTTLVDGRLPRTDGEAVADAADEGSGFLVGATVTVVPGDVELTIVGLAEEIGFNVQPTVFTTFATYERVVRETNPSATAVLPSLVAVHGDPEIRPEALAARITDEVEGVEALDRATAVDSLPGVDSVRQSFSIILGLAFVVVALLTGFFFLIITVQKTTALTLLRAVGASTGALLRALVVQVLLVVAVASIVAVALAVPAVRGVSDEGLGAGVDPFVAGITIAGMLALGLVAAVGSMRRISRLEPAAATQRLAGGGLA